MSSDPLSWKLPATETCSPLTTTTKETKLSNEIFPQKYLAETTCRYQALPRILSPNNRVPQQQIWPSIIRVLASHWYDKKASIRCLITRSTTVMSPLMSCHTPDRMLVKFLQKRSDDELSWLKVIPTSSRTFVMWIFHFKNCYTFNLYIAFRKIK